MSKTGKLFDLVVPEHKLDTNFARVSTATTSIAARAMLEDVFETFEDPDGNFKEQMQTTAFDSRFFELYLYAYFSRSGFALDRSFSNPDFIVERDGTRVAVEATTVNPSTSGVIAKYGKRIEGLNEGELGEYIREELPLRFGSALFSKLNKKYWEKPHCAGLPLVIAIQAFHDEGSLHFSDTGLSEYVYASRQTARWSDNGELVLTNTSVESHTLGEKTIPSGFFNQPGAENISAIVFSNSGTHAKFTRMGYQSGFGTDTLKVQRIGRVFDPSPDSMDAALFAYDMDDPNVVEPWGQGLTVLHNPKALIPVPDGFFSDANEHHLIDGDIVASANGWHPFNSKTIVLDFGEARKKRVCPCSDGARPTRCGRYSEAILLVIESHC